MIWLGSHGQGAAERSSNRDAATVLPPALIRLRSRALRFRENADLIRAVAHSPPFGSRSKAKVADLSGARPLKSRSIVDKRQVRRRVSESYFSSHFVRYRGG